MIKQLEAEPRRLSTDIWSHTEAYQSLKVNGGRGGNLKIPEEGECVCVHVGVSPTVNTSCQVCMPVCVCVQQKQGGKLNVTDTD